MDGVGTGMSEAKILELLGMILDLFLPKGSELVANFVNQMVLSTNWGMGFFLFLKIMLKPLEVFLQL